MGSWTGVRGLSLRVRSWWARFGCRPGPLTRRTGHAASPPPREGTRPTDGPTAVSRITHTRWALPKRSSILRTLSPTALGSRWEVPADAARTGGHPGAPRSDPSRRGGRRRRACPASRRPAAEGRARCGRTRRASSTRRSRHRCVGGPCGGTRPRFSRGPTGAKGLFSTTRVLRAQPHPFPGIPKNPPRGIRGGFRPTAEFGLVLGTQAGRRKGGALRRVARQRRNGVPPMGNRGRSVGG